MAKKSEVVTPKCTKRSGPAMTQEAKESQLIALAYDLAEERMLNGTATSQEIVHFLKLGSTKDRIEREILERQKDLVSAKTEALQAQKRIEELLANAVTAMKAYSGVEDQDRYDEDLY